MMEFIVNLLVSAGVLMVMAYIMPQVTVKSFTTALGVALLVGILNATIGWVLGGIFNLFTLFLISFIVKLIVSALMIKLADKLMSNFSVDGFWPALVIAIALAAASTLVERVMNDNDQETIEQGY
jgi:putative membrane protein